MPAKKYPLEVAVRVGRDPIQKNMWFAEVVYFRGERVIKREPLCGPSHRSTAIAKMQGEMIPLFHFGGGVIDESE